MRATQDIQSCLWIRSEMTGYGVGLLRIPTLSMKSRPEPTSFTPESLRPDSGPDYVGKDPIGAGHIRLSDLLETHQVRYMENAG